MNKIENPKKFNQQKKKKSDLQHQQSLREKLIQNYENRIRNLSTPEKIFGYFASVEKDGELLMTPEDFIRSLTPYDFPHGGVPSSKRQWSEVAGRVDIPNFFKFCDVNGDGLLSFAEYLFFVTLLSIPEHEFRYKLSTSYPNKKKKKTQKMVVLQALTHKSMSSNQKQSTESHSK